MSRFNWAVARERGGRSEWGMLQPVVVSARTHRQSSGRPFGLTALPDRRSGARSSAQRSAVHVGGQTDGGQIGTQSSTAPNSDEWESRRPELYADYISSLPGALLLNNEEAEACGKQLHKAVCDAATGRSCSQCLATEFRFMRNVEVMYVTERYLVRVDLPVYQCVECSSQFSARPGEVNCLPGGPGEHYDISKAAANTRPMWFDHSLLQLCHLLQMRDGAKTSVQKLADVLRRHYVFNGCPAESVGSDVFRKRLGAALQQFDFLRCHVEHVGNLDVPGWPSDGPVPQCGGCWNAGPGQAMQDVHCDFCFKLPHLRRSGREDDFLKPPTSPRHYTPASMDLGS